MLIIIISEQKEYRNARIQEIVTPLTTSEVLVFDDTIISVGDLEQYLYPSLFTLSSPIIHTRFLLDGKGKEMDTAMLKKLSSSPTIFIFEEFAVASPLITSFKKHGAVVHAAEKNKSAKKESTIFSVTKALTASDKKSRWMAYREAMHEHAIEAVLGILYWKVRELLGKSSPKDRARYEKLYTDLLHAQARAWETGAPLELMIEKVILMQ